MQRYAMGRNLAEWLFERHADRMTWREWVWWAGRECQLTLTDAQIDNILWEHTAWPFASADHVQAQVKAYLQETGNRDEPMGTAH